MAALGGATGSITWSFSRELLVSDLAGPAHGARTGCPTTLRSYRRFAGGTFRTDDHDLLVVAVEKQAPRSQQVRPCAQQRTEGAAAGLHHTWLESAALKLGERLPDPAHRRMRKQQGTSGIEVLRSAGADPV